jgi:hypothetical protein
MYSSTCFARPHTHHQELNNCSSSLWFYRWSVVVAVPDHDQQHCYYHAPKVKPEAATAFVEFLMIGASTPKTCWAVHKRQVINLRNCCIWLVDLFEMYCFIDFRMDNEHFVVFVRILRPLNLHCDWQRYWVTQLHNSYIKQCLPFYPHF